MLPCPPVLVLLQTEQFRQSEYPLGMVKEHKPHRRREGGRERRGKNGGSLGRKERGREGEVGGEADFEGTKCREA